MTVVADRRRVQAAIDRAVDPRVGIVHDLQSMAPRPGAPRVFHCSAQLCNLSACGWEGNLTRLDAAAATPEDAQASAFFDALGCYAAAFYAPHELELFPYARAPHRSVAPSRFALFADEQYAEEAFPYEPFTDATPVRWIRATSLETGDDWHVPAAAALLPYAVRGGSGEASIQPSSPIGLACAFSREEAIRSAVCDVIKHDALALCWNGRVSPPHVRIETLSDENYALEEWFETIGKLTALDITLDTKVPTFLLCLECPAERAPAMVFASGCHPDPDRAFRLALDDLGLVLRLCQDVPRVHERPGDANGRRVDHRLDRLAYWCTHAHTSDAAFLFASFERLDFEETRAPAAVATPGDSRALAAALGAAGHEVFIADLTTSDLRELGVSVVRAVIPGLQPLFAARHEQALGGTRLHDIPARLGLRPAALEASTRPADVPHPFVLRGIPW